MSDIPTSSQSSGSQFVRRFITVKFDLGKGSFGDSGFNSVSISGLRVSATISKPGGNSLSSLEARIWGLPLSQSNQLSTLGQPIAGQRNNNITLSVGDDPASLTEVFTGTITTAWVNGDAAPDVPLTVSASTGYINKLIPLPASSYSGSVDAATVLKTLAGQMGYQFENNGASVMMSNCYLVGSPLQQAQTLAFQAGISMIVDGNTLAIWPRGGSRKQGGSFPLISPDTGLIGYPAHTDNGISLRTVYNPSIIFGQQVTVQSALTPASGSWVVYSVKHDLECETPNGKWETTMECNKLGVPSTIK